MHINKPRTLSRILGSYYIVSILILCGIILFLTYSSATKAINIEFGKSFEQRFDIAQNIIEHEAERLEDILHEIQFNNRLLSKISITQTPDALQYFKNHIDALERNKCDVLFIQRTNTPVWINASSPVPNVEPILETIAAQSRKFLRKPVIAQFKNNGTDLTGVFRSKKIILEDGQVLGIAISGTILNNNLWLLNKIKKRTKSPIVILTENKNIIASTTNKEFSVLEDIIHHSVQGDLHTLKNSQNLDQSDQVLSHFQIALDGRETFLNIILSMDNEGITKLNRTYLKTLVIILTVFAVFFFVTLFVIQRRIYPSVKKILHYTHKIVNNDDQDIALVPGSIIELNTIGAAMENMVTSINRTQEKLKQSETKYRDFIDKAPDLRYRTNLEGTVVFVSQSSFNMTGYTVDEAVDLKVPEDIYVNPEQRKDFLAALEKKGYINDFESLLKKKDGSHWWASTNAQYYRKLNGEIEGVEGVTRDITERKMAEKALRESEVKYRNLFESSMDAILLLEPDKGYLDCNKAALRLFGVESKAHLLTLKPDDLSPRYQSDGMLSSQKAGQEIAKTMETGSNLFEWTHQRINGEKFFASVLVTFVTIEGRPILQGTIRDITDFKRSQEVMVQSEKMMSVGGLAAGMAHEINNPLGIILQTVQNVSRRLGTELAKNKTIASQVGLDLDLLQVYMRSRSIDTYLVTIKEAGERAAKIVRSMLDFSRKSESQKAMHSINTILDGVIDMASNDYDLKKKYDFKSVDIRCDYEDIPEIMCTETEIAQVFLNLIKNAAQAMALNGYNGERPCITLKSRKRGDKVIVSIQDNGQGMDGDSLKRIFEPFFTSKAPGEGTGLGLSVSYFIITAHHGGNIDVHSQLGQGTCFTVELPIDKGIKIES